MRLLKEMNFGGKQSQGVSMALC